MDPSHLFWQGIDPLAALEQLGSLVYNAAAKDTRINAAANINRRGTLMRAACPSGVHGSCSPVVAQALEAHITLDR